MSKFSVNEIVSISPIDKNFQHLVGCKGIIKKVIKDKNYLIYSCYDGDLIDLKESELIKTGKISKPSKFDFYEIVKSSSGVNSLNLAEGFIGGKSQDDSGEWSYSVFLFKKQAECCFEEYELESTGQFVKKEDYYSGESVKVIVHPDGRGELKEE